MWSDVSDRRVERFVWFLETLGVEGRRKAEVLLRREDGASRLRRRFELMIASKRGTEGSAGLGAVGEEVQR